MESFLRRISITQVNKRLALGAGIVFWLLVWQIAAMAVGHDILLVSPVKVVLRLFSLVREGEFWSSILFSALRIAIGFLLATLVGIILALLSAKALVIRIILKPLVETIKATPVASIVIVVLIWISSRNLSVVISFMMVFPIMYTNILSGIDNTPKELLEMAFIFRLPFKKKLKAIYIPAVLPYFVSALNISLGLAWKSGVAAEVIGIPSGSIGEKLYQAKIFFSTADVFAWTVTIICLSVLFEKFFSYLIKVHVRRCSR